MDVETLEQVLRKDEFSSNATQVVDGERVAVWTRQYDGHSAAGGVTHGAARLTLRLASKAEIRAQLTGRLPQEYAEAVLLAGVPHWQCKIEVDGWTSNQAKTSSEVFDLHTRFLTA